MRRDEPQFEAEVARKAIRYLEEGFEKNESESGVIKGVLKSQNNNTTFLKINLDVPERTCFDAFIETSLVYERPKIERAYLQSIADYLSESNDFPIFISGTFHGETFDASFSEDFDKETTDKFQSSILEQLKSAISTSHRDLKELKNSKSEEFNSLKDSFYEKLLSITNKKGDMQ